MNALNHAVTAVFDVLMWPLDRLGPVTALVVASGVFGVIALIAFKYLSRQKAIAAAKDKIKAHLIEIRIYQDDPRIVARAIGKILMRNGQYLALNLMPFVPLSLPFVLVVAQLVVRHAHAPVPLHAETKALLAGQGTTLQVTMTPAAAARVGELTIHYPEGIRAVSPLVRIASEGRAFQEIVALESGSYAIELSLADGTSESKRLYAGDVAPRASQPARDQSFWSALLWPAEDQLASTSPFERIAIEYPDADLGWLPSGPGGVLLVFLVSSMLFGALAIKPLKIQI